MWSTANTDAECATFRETCIGTVGCTDYEERCDAMGLNTDRRTPVGKPCEGKPHARFDEGGLETRLDSGKRLVCGQPPREAPSGWCASPPLYHNAFITQ